LGFLLPIPLSQLKDLMVLELASVLAGPGVGQFFAELGARVIKVENVKTNGDVTRGWKSRHEDTDDRSAYFCAVNWGKQSIALDLTTDEGVDIVHRLAAQSDIVISSFKPGDAEKLHVDYPKLSRNHPELIYGQITGYGSHDPRVGYDAIIQAEAGFMYLNGEPGGKSLKMPVALVDILAGHHLKEGLLLALLERATTKRGKLVAVSLIQAAAASLANQATNYLVGGFSPDKEGSAHPNIAPYGDVYLSADQKEVLLAVGTDRQFEVLCNVLDIAELTKDDRFRTNPSRVAHRSILQELISRAISSQAGKTLVEKLTEQKVPAALVQNIPEALSDPEINKLMLSGGHLKSLRTYAVSDSTSILSHLLPPPRLGEHTDSILQGMLNFSPTAVLELHKRAIIK
jgi:crotonobetainyl-CoA:carnitine CoA-transferase CaiB-like acyl-CoA transferase